MNDKSLTINGAPVHSGKPVHVSLSKGPNRFAIVVTSADGTRTYLLNVERAAS